MNVKIVADSSANLLSFEGVPYESVPLKIISKGREYVDNAELDVAGMVEDLHKEKTGAGTSCPNVMDWMEAFGDADAVFAVAITSNLSGCCNAAMQAAEMYKGEHECAKVCVLDSLSTAGEMHLIVEKLRDLIAEGLCFEAVEAKIRAYMKHTHLLFTLQSLANLAKNGRVSPAVAKIAGVLGICVVGKASDVGTLQQMHKCRGEKRSLETLMKEMVNHGFAGGRVRIDHCMNLNAAKQLHDMILAQFPGSDIKIGQCGALCSFYAEKGGMIIGFEDALA